MLTCFLFIQSKDDLDAILSLRMDLHEQVDQPLKMRTLDEIRVLQEHARTILVLPTGWCGVYQVELPLLPERKAREAIPFALEDQLAQSVAHMHFAFDKAHYHHGHYVVAVIDKHLMTDWMAKLNDLNLNYDQITFDWFALHPDEACVGTDAILIHSDSFRGVLSPDIWEHHDHEWSKTLQWQVFDDSLMLADWSKNAKHTQDRYSWIAARLLKNRFVNLCQGDFQHATSQAQVQLKYQWAGILAVTWLVCFIGIHAGLYGLLTRQSHQLDQQIATLYRTFFPGAQQVISPKVRIAQLLKQNQSGQNTTMWTLFENFSLALQSIQTPSTHKPNTKMTSMLQSMQFQNQILTVMLHCDNFSVLEKIENYLRKKSVHVKQVSAATENDQVMAKLELSL